MNSRADFFVNRFMETINGDKNNVNYNDEDFIEARTTLKSQQKSLKVLKDIISMIDFELQMTVDEAVCKLTENVNK